MNGPAFSLNFSKSMCFAPLAEMNKKENPVYPWQYSNGFDTVLRLFINNLHLRNPMSSKDGKIFDTIVYIGLGVNGLTAIYLLLVYFEII